MPYGPEQTVKQVMKLWDEEIRARVADGIMRIDSDMVMRRMTYKDEMLRKIKNEIKFNQSQLRKTNADIAYFESQPKSDVSAQRILRDLRPDVDYYRTLIDLYKAELAKAK